MSYLNLFLSALPKYPVLDSLTARLREACEVRPVSCELDYAHLFYCGAHNNLFVIQQPEELFYGTFESQSLTVSGPLQEMSLTQHVNSELFILACSIQSNPGRLPSC